MRPTGTPASRVLVVEDENLLRELVVVLLRDAGYEVDSVRDGMDGLDRLAASAYHVILLDVRMPRLDGWATLARLRSLGHQTPVVMMSGHAEVSDALARGANALLLKPFDNDHLVETVARWAAVSPTPEVP